MAVAKFRARFGTAGRIDPIENWLKLNIEGEWSIKMDSIADDMKKKNFSLYFESEEDRNAFRRRFTMGKEAYEQAKVPVKKGFLSSLFGSSKTK